MINNLWLLLLVLLCSCLPPLPIQAETQLAATASPSPIVTPLNTEYPRATPTKAVCIVSTGYEEGTVNVRSGSGMKYAVVDIAYEGESLIVFGTVENGWQRVTTPRLVNGWFYIVRWCNR